MKLVAKVKRRYHRDRNELCRNYFRVCSSAELLNSHQKVCLENDSVQITMPTVDKIVKFENYAARWFSPFEVYLDLESLVVPAAKVKDKPTISGTLASEQNLPCSCMMVVERNNPEPLHFDIYTGPDCKERFLKKIEKLAKHFYQQKCFLGTAPPRDTWSKCWICNFDFNSDTEKVLNHCHFNGQFILSFTVDKN